MSKAPKPEIVIQRLRENVKDLFPEMNSEEIEGALAKLVIYARQEIGLPDIPPELVPTVAERLRRR